MFYLWAHGVGPLGVQIFFAISGFVITRLLIAEEDSDGRICVRCFYIRRLFRIVPALALFIGFVGLIDALGLVSVPRANFLAASTFLCNTTLVDCGYNFAHLWSLSVEEQFYLVWPCIFVLLSNRYRSTTILLIFAGCMAFAMVPSLKIGWLNNGLSFGCIAAGAGYALSHRTRGFFKARVRIPLWLSGVTLVFALPLFGSLSPSLWWLSTLITPFLIVAAVLTRAEEDPRMGRNFLMRSLREVGLISYSLYLWHCMFAWEPRVYRSEIFFYTSIPIGLLFAWFSGQYMERVFIRIGRRLALNVSGQGASPKTASSQGTSGAEP
jgi:peptidoglycan/LPS O-acetylase OafA/YrhL